MMENDASWHEYEDGLEAAGEIEQVVVSDAVCNPVETQMDDAVESIDNERGVDQKENNFPTEVAAEPLTAQEEGNIGELSTIDGAAASDVDQSSRRQEKEEQPRQKSRHGPKNHQGSAEGKDLEIATLIKKMNQAKKINSELHNQLQRFYTNDVVVQLENRVKEKQKRIEELIRENRMLKNSERLLSKELEDIQSSKDNFPSKKRALQEELRVCKERIKQLKEQYRVADEKGFKLHQQSFDLAVKNKGLSEKVRLLEGCTASTSPLSPALSSARIGAGPPIEGTSPEEVQAIIASQEVEITRLHQRVALMKKTHKIEQIKYERLLKAGQDEIEQTRAEMEEFYQQLFAKERAARVQFLHMKKLKHALHELAITQQTNQRFQPFLVNREMRITNRSNNNSRHPQAGPHFPQKGPTLNGGRWITEALHHLGFVMPLSSHLGGSTTSLVENVPEKQADIPENCIQGRLVPFPPPSTVARAKNSTRLQFYDSSNPKSGSARNNGDISDVSEQGNTEDNEEENQDTAEIPAGTKGTTLHVPENPGIGLS